MAFRGQGGFTLPEVMISSALAVLFFTSLILAFMSVKAINVTARYRMQAAQLVRGTLETLKGTEWAVIDNSVTQSVTFDPGPDQTYGTGDDLRGTLTVSVVDALDMDDDDNVQEARIDIDGDGVNDANAAKPVRVVFSWSQNVMGKDRSYSVWADTLIAR